MDEVIQRFPMVAKEILDELDNRTLTDCKRVSKHWCHFIDNQKTPWIRRIQIYIKRNNDHLEDWKKVIFRAPVQVLKELALATEKIFTLKDTQLWKMTYENKLVNKNGKWRFSEKIWHIKTLNNKLYTMSSLPLSWEPYGTFIHLQDQASNNFLTIATNHKEVELREKYEDLAHLKFKITILEPFEGLEHALATIRHPKLTNFKIDIKESDDTLYNFDNAFRRLGNPKSGKQIWTAVTVFNGWFKIINNSLDQSDQCPRKVLTSKDANNLTVDVEENEIFAPELSPFRVLAELGYSDSYQYVAEKLGRVNPVCHKGWYSYWTSFHVSARRGHTKICRYIISNLVNKNPPEEESRRTPLLLAIIHGHLETVKIIMEHLDDKNPSFLGESALQLAMWQKLYERQEDMYYCMETMFMSLGIKYHPNFDLQDENHIQLRKQHQQKCNLCFHQVMG